MGGICSRTKALNLAAGKVTKGLVLRREAEATLFLLSHPTTKLKIAMLTKTRTFEKNSELSRQLRQNHQSSKSLT